MSLFINYVKLISKMTTSEALSSLNSRHFVGFVSIRELSTLKILQSPNHRHDIFSHPFCSMTFCFWIICKQYGLYFAAHNLIGWNSVLSLFWELLEKIVTSIINKSSRFERLPTAFNRAFVFVIFPSFNEVQLLNKLSSFLFISQRKMSLLISSL